MLGHALEEADEREVVGQGLGGGDDLDEVGRELFDARIDVVEVACGGEVVVAEDERDAGVAELLEFAPASELSADSSSRSARWNPASDARDRISSSAATLPANLPPFASRRQVAMAVTAVFSSKNCLIVGKCAEGLSR